MMVMVRLLLKKVNNLSSKQLFKKKSNEGSTPLKNEVLVDLESLYNTNNFGIEIKEIDFAEYERRKKIRE